MNLFSNIVSSVKENLKMSRYNKMLQKVNGDTNVYEELVELIKKASTLGNVLGLLNWDQDVVMPSGNQERRSEEIGLIAEISHKASTDPRIGKLIKKAKQCKYLSDDEKLNLKLIEEDYLDALKIPDSLVKQIAEVTSKSESVWKQAKEENNFEMFLPYLEEIVDLYKNKYAPLVDKDKLPYEVMLSDYEDDFTIKDMNTFFDEIKKEIVPLVEKISQKSCPKEFNIIPFGGAEMVCDINKWVAESLGYDFGRGRLDAGVHPMTGYEGRITTNYTHGWWDAISSTIHEAGHALYFYGLPEQYRGLPLGEDLSMAVHESQSRFWENHVGKSREFCEFLFNNEYTKHLDSKKCCDDFYRSINIVRPSLIRIRADELTYNLHVILRFELEQEMFSGMDLASLPRKWSDKMEEYLGIRPTTDSDGCLFDCHWGCGLLGYFPTYILGSMMSAQLATAMKKDIPGFYKLIEVGKFEEHREWLKDKIHRHGRRYNTKELIKRATGKEPDCEDYIRYLKDKFGKLYDL